MERGSISVRASKVILRDTDELLQRMSRLLEHVNRTLEAACGDDLFQMRQHISSQSEWDMELYSMLDALDARLTDLRVHVDPMDRALEQHRDRIREFELIPTPEEEQGQSERQQRDSLMARIRARLGNDYDPRWEG
jgi:hypothetical protein